MVQNKSRMKEINASESTPSKFNHVIKKFSSDTEANLVNFVVEYLTLVRSLWTQDLLEKVDNGDAAPRSGL